MAKQKKNSFVSTYKKLAKEKRAKREAQLKQDVLTVECGGNKENIIFPTLPLEEPRVYASKQPTKVLEEKPRTKVRAFRRDLKKLHSVWDFVKSNNLILKTFDIYTIRDGKKVPVEYHTRYVKFLRQCDRFWLINVNYKFDITKMFPKNEIIGAHIYQDGNMQFTTKTNLFITCEPYFGKKTTLEVKKDGYKQ